MGASSRAEAVIEEIAGRWLKELLGLPPDASFAFTTGTQMAHVTALAAARGSLLAQRGWDAERQGLAGAPAIRVLTGGHQHSSIDRAVRLLGLGTDAICAVGADDRCRLDVAALERELTGEPTIVCLQAGEINTGSFDPFADACRVAHERGAWVHVDGAFGLWAAVSERHRELVAGVEQADSWTTDGHKWLNVPFDCGFAFVRDADAHHAAIRALGRDGIRAVVERCGEHARRLTREIGALPGTELVVEPVLNQGLVRFGDRTDAVIARIQAGGEAWFGGTTFEGARAIRISVVNWRTSDADVDRAVAAVRAALNATA